MSAAAPIFSHSSHGRVQMGGSDRRGWKGASRPDEEPQRRSEFFRNRAHRWVQASGSTAIEQRDFKSSRDLLVNPMTLQSSHQARRSILDIPHSVPRGSDSSATSQAAAKRSFVVTPPRLVRASAYGAGRPLGQPPSYVDTNRKSKEPADYNSADILSSSPSVSPLSSFALPLNVLASQCVPLASGQGQEFIRGGLASRAAMVLARLRKEFTLWEHETFTATMSSYLGVGMESSRRRGSSERIPYSSLSGHATFRIEGIAYSDPVLEQARSRLLRASIYGEHHCVEVERDQSPVLSHPGHRRQSASSQLLVHARQHTGSPASSKDGEAVLGSRTTLVLSTALAPVTSGRAEAELRRLHQWLEKREEAILRRQVQKTAIAKSHDAGGFLDEDEDETRAASAEDLDQHVESDTIDLLVWKPWHIINLTSADINTVAGDMAHATASDVQEASQRQIIIIPRFALR